MWFLILYMGCRIVIFGVLLIVLLVLLCCIIKVVVVIVVRCNINDRFRMVYSIRVNVGMIYYMLIDIVLLLDCVV